jgi:hypothetical protein
LAVFNAFSHASETLITTIEGLTTPNEGAIGPNGDIYVTVSGSNRIRVYDHHGDLKKTLGIKSPSVIAVDTRGLIYLGIGRHAGSRSPERIAGEVRVYDGELTYLRSLGSGAGEFQNPTDIYIDKAGTVYVTDSDAHEIKVFDADGVLQFAFGQQGAGDGHFNVPLAVAVDETTGEIYVSDKQLIPNSSGGQVSGARVQVYSSAGQFIRGFGSYELGELISPADIELYNGRLYIADSYQNVVQVYDSSSGEWEYSHVCEAPDGLMRMPVSLDISEDGIMYVVSVRTDKIYVFGIDDYVDFKITPEELQFEAIEGGLAPAEQAVTIINTGQGELDWRATTGESWITLGSTGGTIGAGQQGILQIGVTTEGLSRGRYEGTVSIRSAGGAEETLTVSLNVAAPPVLSVQPGALSFTADSGGGAPSAQSIQVTLSNALAGSIWEATTDAGWLSVNPVQAGRGQTDAVVRVNGAGLSAGEHRAQITVVSAGASGSPVDVTVDLTVLDSGVISVTTNHTEAAFTVTGDNGKGYEGSGTDWSVSNVPDGSYTIQYSDRVGYRSPESETKELIGGGEIAFTGTYEEIGPDSIVTTGEGKKAEAVVRVYDGSGVLQHEFTAFRAQQVNGKSASVRAAASADRAEQGGLDTAVGDVDGDGTSDIVASLLSGAALVGIFDARGSVLTEFVAFPGDSGADVAVGDLDGDGTIEILAQSRVGSAAIKAFQYTDGVVTDTGIALIRDTAGQVAMGSADVDGDGRAEMLTLVVNTSGPEPRRNKLRTSGHSKAEHVTMLQIWGVDTAGGTGAWELTLEGQIELTGSGMQRVTAGDLDGDAVADIVVASENSVLILGADGTVKGEIAGSGISDVVVGDADGDGRNEIIIGRSGGSVTVLTTTGARVSDFTAFDSRLDIRVSTGDLGY